MKYSIGRIHHTTHGTYRARLTVNGQRHQKTLKTIQQAKDYIDALVINVYRSPKTLSPDQYHDALRAIEILPDGATLLDAARAYHQNHTKTTTPIDTQTAVQQFLTQKTQAGRRPTTTTSHKSLLKKLQPGHPLSQWTPADIADIVQNMHPVTRNNHLRIFSNFFRWAQTRNYIHQNPTAGVDRAIEDQNPPPILTVHQTRTLLQTAQKHDPPLVPAIAIAAFAGLRTAELKRLHQKNIHLKAGYIHVNAGAAKTRKQRFTQIHPTLKSWLQKHPVQGPICPRNWRKRIKAVRTLAKIKKWPTNAHRHSYVTYHLAAYHDAPQTAHQLGHPHPELLYRRYRNLATQAQANAYFQITPPSR